MVHHLLKKKLKMEIPTKGTVHLDRPELVIQSIREVVGAARSDSELKPHRNKKFG
jgi:hypothetical protein